MNNNDEAVFFANFAQAGYCKMKQCFYGILPRQIKRKHVFVNEVMCLWNSAQVDLEKKHGFIDEAMFVQKSA